MASSAPNFVLALAPDCVGLPHPTVQAKIVDDTGHTLPDGAEGNIMLRSPMVMIEYLGHPEANAETLTIDRWLQTGDYGRLENGLLFPGVPSEGHDLFEAVRTFSPSKWRIAWKATPGLKRLRCMESTTPHTDRSCTL